MSTSSTRVARGRRALFSAWVLASTVLLACSSAPTPPRVEASPPKVSPSASATPPPLVRRGRGVVWDTTSLAAGASHTCAIRAHGRVMCWGHNDGGQIGDGSTTDRPSPEIVEGVDGATAITTGGRRSCAIVDAGGIRCWGGAAIGSGRTLGVTAIGDVEDAVEIVSSTWISCARRRSGEVACFGSDGGLRFARDFKDAVELAAGASEVCARFADGTVRCAAQSVSGLGPVRPVDEVKGAVQIALAGASACALSPEGKLRCWTFEKRFDEELPTFSSEMAGISDVLELAGGFGRMCAATPTGVTCFSDVVAGRGARGRPAIEARFEEVPALRDYRSVASGLAHTCGEAKDGGLWCWGADEATLGAYPRAGTEPVPVAVEGVSDAVELFAGENATCARRRDGHVACWGRGPFAVSSEDGRAHDLPDLEGATALTGGLQFACAKRGFKASMCWGLATWRGCTFRSPDNCQPEKLAAPREVPRLLDVLGASSISDRCAARVNGTVACLEQGWGGHLKTTEVSGVRGAKSVSGWCALDRAGKVSCWGRNEVGQLGDGSRYTRPDAVEVYGLPAVVEVVTGTQHVCARAKDGGVSCWGSNASGQLGDGSRIDRQRPVSVAVAGATQIVAGARFSCALLGDRSVRCWGSNARGALGDGSFRDQSKPVVVAGITDAVEIAAGYEHACARRASGAVSCWGQSEQASPAPVDTTSPHRVLEPPAP